MTLSNSFTDSKQLLGRYCSNRQSPDFQINLMLTHLSNDKCPLDSRLPSALCLIVMSLIMGPQMLMAHRDCFKYWTRCFPAFTDYPSGKTNPQAQEPSARLSNQPSRYLNKNGSFSGSECSKSCPCHCP